ncbi:MAG: Rpn family recombination-promoting nuclease/putative transposase [Planctomycetes bacterium]|nr:Rpn family recombination-promoting nuclease/putative transposase [Planctomycetota bacterium]
MGHRHDQLFQLIFAAPEHAAPLLQTALAPAVVQAIDWATLCRCEPDQRSRRGRRTICDLLFAVTTRGGGGLLLYVVLEHKSASSRFDALQMLEQVTAVLRTWRREHPREPFLPPVLPVVVHADQRPWRSPLQVRELFDLANVPAALHRFLPSLQFVLDDLREQPPEALRQRALSVLGLCALSALQYLPAAADDAAAFEAWVATWRVVLQQASRFADETSNEELFLAVVDYVLETSDLPRQIVHRVLDHQLTDDAMKKKFVSTLTQTRNEGRDEGRVEGRNEGRADLLLRQLARRFGAEAAKAAEQRVRGAVAAELDRFAERVLDARTIDDVFGTADRG